MRVHPRSASHPHLDCVCAGVRDGGAPALSCARAPVCVEEGSEYAVVESKGARGGAGCDRVEARDCAARVACRRRESCGWEWCGWPTRERWSAPVGRACGPLVLVRVCPPLSLSLPRVRCPGLCLFESGGYRAHRLLPPVGAGCGAWGLRPASCEPCSCRGLWHPEDVGARVSVPVAHGG